MIKDIFFVTEMQYNYYQLNFKIKNYLLADRDITRLLYVINQNNFNDYWSAKL